MKGTNKFSRWRSCVLSAETLVFSYYMHGLVLSDVFTNSVVICGIFVDTMAPIPMILWRHCDLLHQFLPLDITM